jgi:hypothetical protein
LSFERRLDLLNVPYIDVDYATDLLTGDINGDGCDDILVFAWNLGRPYWDLFLGNPAATLSQPDKALRSDSGWAPQRWGAKIMDVDGDGFDDILNTGSASVHRRYGDALLFRGSAELPDIIRPNDSIPNSMPYEYGFLGPGSAYPVGDMNGDGIPDFIIGWNHELGPGGASYRFYPGGHGYKTALGRAGTDPHLDYHQPGLFHIGDVNGDGYDDILARGRGRGHGPANRFRIYLGARALRTSATAPPVPDEMQLALAPNPLPSGAASLHLHASGLAPGQARIQLHDTLGRLLADYDLPVNGTTLDTVLTLPRLSAGSYRLTLRQDRIRAHGALIVR